MKEGENAQVPFDNNCCDRNIAAADSKNEAECTCLPHVGISVLRPDPLEIRTSDWKARSTVVIVQMVAP